MEIADVRRSVQAREDFEARRSMQVRCLRFFRFCWRNLHSSWLMCCHLKTSGRPTKMTSQLSPYSRAMLWVFGQNVSDLGFALIKKIWTSDPYHCSRVGLYFIKITVVIDSTSPRSRPLPFGLLNHTKCFVKIQFETFATLHKENVCKLVR